MESNKRIKIATEYLTIILCGFILAINYHLFVINNQFAPSGINGVATMIQYKYGFSIGYMSLLINIPLCTIGYFLVNRDFACKSFVFSLAYSLSYLLLQQSDDLQRFAYNAQGVDTVLPVLVAGVVAGVIYGFCFRSGGSTAGTDIISKVISVRRPQFNFFWVTFTLNVLVALASFFVYAVPGESGELVYNFKPVVLCIIYCFCSSEIGNRMIRGSQSAIKCEIITNEPAAIAAIILHQLHRGVTKVEARGMYTETDRSLLICVIAKHDLPDLEKILRDFPGTFAYMQPVNEIVGNFYHPPVRSLLPRDHTAEPTDTPDERN